MGAGLRCGGVVGGRWLWGVSVVLGGGDECGAVGGLKETDEK